MTTRGMNAPRTQLVFQRLVMTTDEAADYLRISRRTLERWTGRGLIKRYDMRGPDVPGRPMWRYRKEDLDAFLLGADGGGALRDRLSAFDAVAAEH